jgi:50S ribosomal protein L16 3-hydroxylase
MIVFNEISQELFLTEYWQKKPLLIKQAIPNFISPISPNELAEISLEYVIESRIIKGSTNKNKWSLNNGPFTQKTFSQLPSKDWTLLIQGLDRFVDVTHKLIENFDFIPRWRFDDVMASYAVSGGSVGPHFDYYDVFLLQSSGRRRWNLSSKNCIDDNYIDDVPLKIMNVFEPEQTFEVSAGDLLYIPPKIAHHGISLDDECITLSFGYRSYTNQEIVESTGNYDSLINEIEYYQDPTWNIGDHPGLITQSAIDNANKLSRISPHDFACFATKIDNIDLNILQNFQFQTQSEEFDKNIKYLLHPSSKVAYTLLNKDVLMYINGENILINDSNNESIANFCNNRQIDCKNSDIFSINLAKKLFQLGLLDKVI